MKNYIEKEVAIENSDLKEIWFSNKYTMIPDFLINRHRIYSIIIPNPVKRICNNAFRGCSELYSVSLPDSLCSIGCGAFSWCGSLTSITIPESVTSIGACAFLRCSKLESITIPSNVSDIGCSAFVGCWDLKSVTILGGVIPDFGSCRKLSSITIGGNLKDLTSGSFGDSKQIKSIVVDKNNKYLDSRDNCNAIIETSSDTLLFACNSTKIPEGIKHISRWAFGNCGRIKTLSLPGSLESIDGLPENVKKIIVPKGRKREFRKKLPRTRGIELVEK